MLVITRGYCACHEKWPAGTSRKGTLVQEFTVKKPKGNRAYPDLTPAFQTYRENSSMWTPCLGKEWKNITIYLIHMCIYIYICMYMSY